MMIADGCAGGPDSRRWLSICRTVHAAAAPYALCRDGLRAGPYLVHSDDGGDRWSDSVQVPKTPPAHDGGQRQTSTIAVNGDGIVAVTPAPARQRLSSSNRAGNVASRWFVGGPQLLFANTAIETRPGGVPVYTVTPRL